MRPNASKRAAIPSTFRPLSPRWRKKGGMIVGASVVARDITEHREVQSTILGLRALVEASDDAIIGKTMDGTILSWNKGAEKIYGYTAEEILGRPISVL